MPIRVVNGILHVRFQESGHTYQTTTKLADTPANRKLALQIEEQERRKILLTMQSGTPRITARAVGDVVTDFLDDLRRKDMHDDSKDIYREQLKKLCGYFGERTLLITIGPRQVEEYLASRVGIQEVTRVTYAHVISRMFEYAVAMRWCRGNPVLALGLKKPQLPKRFIDITPEEEARYFDAARRYPVLHDLAKVIRLQGARPSELLALDWDHINLEKRELFIMSGKTRAARRVLPLTNEAHRLLRDRKLPGSEWVFPSIRNARIPLDYDVLNQLHNRARSAAGLWRLDGRGRFDLYAFRHLFASEMIRHADVRVLQALMGHASIVSTLRYIHISDSDVRKAMNRFNAAYGSTLVDDAQPKARCVVEASNAVGWTQLKRAVERFEADRIAGK